MTGTDIDEITTDDDYIMAVYAHLRRRSRYDRIAGDDVVQRCIIRIIPGVSHYRLRYPSPSTLAGVLWETGHLDHWRSERVQQAQGARAGSGRRSVDLEHLEAPGVVSRMVDEYASVDDRDELVSLIENLPVQVRRLLWMVNVEGRSVTEAAAAVGWTREHASRQLSKLADTTVQNRPTGR